MTATHHALLLDGRDDDDDEATLAALHEAQDLLARRHELRRSLARLEDHEDR